MKFYYIVHATQSDNVGDLEADSKEDALQKLDEIYTPSETLRKSKLISFELISEDTYHSEKERIDKERLEEANRVEEE